MRKVKILHVLGGLNYGGAETFILNVYNNCNRDAVQFDALVRDSVNLQENRWKEFGGEVYGTAPFPKAIFKNYFQTKKFLKENADKYDAIHIHANALVYVLPIVLAKKYGWKKIILHSHNTRSKAAEFLHKINRALLLDKIDICLSCGVDAGKWMFGKREFQIIKNGINIEKYRYSAATALKKREELGFSSSDFVVGNVGRFSKQKNHVFLLDIFEEVLRQAPHAKLLLVGDGELKKEIKERIKCKKIEDKVVILSNRNDVPELLQAMDVFLFPSLYEGLSIALIEAQSSGLPCVISKNVDKNSAITNQVLQLDLGDSLSKWSDSVAQTRILDSSKRANGAKVVSEHGYDIRRIADLLQNIYSS